MSDSVFRVYPAIGFARVGTSERYYLAPETPAGHPLPGQVQTGGLPIKAGTEDQTITSDDVRDGEGKFLRQAARYRIYQYATPSAANYPMGEAGTEITIGSELVVDGERKQVADILWTVHVANKKTNWYQSADDTGILSWGSPTAPTVPPLRNPKQGPDPDAVDRRRRLIIDPGPRTIHGRQATAVEFDAGTEASYWQSGATATPLPDYPKSFPGDHFKLFPPGVDAITTLGQLETDDRGRLIAVAAYGRANSFLDDPETNYGFTDAVNNDWWFDDTCDGPVDATLVFADGSVRKVDSGAWLVSTDPSYAPQILNVVSLWDDIHDSWVRKLGLRPDLFSNGQFNPSYSPSFEDEVRPIFLAAGLQRWITNLSSLGISAHARVASYTGDTAPASTQLHGLGLIRKPVDPEVPPPANPDREGDDRMMPLSLGDAGRSLLSLSETQYFYLQQWDATRANANTITLNAGEQLDKASFAAGLGGRFSPGIDMTYICREPDLYIDDWASSGPFRVSPAPLNYASVQKDVPLLSAGWTPKRNDNAVEPGDICKFMAIPWHADYNSCGTHLPDPNPEFNNTLYWSWPAQRPVAVYAAKDVAEGKLGKQVFSVRGPGTKTAPVNPDKPPPFGPGNPAEVGRYQVPFDMLAHWHEVGLVIQATNIVGDYDPTFYLEVASQLPEADSDKVQAWPNTVAPGTGT